MQQFEHVFTPENSLGSGGSEPADCPFPHDQDRMTYRSRDGRGAGKASYEESKAAAAEEGAAEGLH